MQIVLQMYPVPLTSLAAGKGQEKKVNFLGPGMH